MDVSNWTFQIQFTSGSTNYIDITNNVLYDSIEKDEQLIGSSYRAADDLLRFEIKHDSTLTTDLFGADQRIKFKCYETTTKYVFTGALDPEFSQEKTDLNGTISFTAYDNGYKLDKPLSASIMYPSTVDGISYSIFATSSTGTSIIHALLSTAGYSSSEIGSTGSILDTVEMVCELENSATYRDVVDQLLWEHGYTYRFDENGVFQTVNLRSSTISASHTFNNTNIATNPGISHDKILFSDEAIEVLWFETELRDGLTVVLYDEMTDRDDYGHYTGNLFSSGGVWPSSSTNNVYQEYDPMYYEYKQLRPGISRRARARLGG